MLNLEFLSLFLLIVATLVWGLYVIDSFTLSLASAHVAEALFE